MGLPAPITLGWEAEDVLSTGAVAHGQLAHVARESVSPRRTIALWGIMFNASSALQGVRDIVAALENQRGLHPVKGHVSLFQGDRAYPPSSNNGLPTWPFTRSGAATPYKYTVVGRALHTRLGRRAR